MSTEATTTIPISAVDHPVAAPAAPPAAPPVIAAPIVATLPPAAPASPAAPQTPMEVKIPWDQFLAMQADRAKYAEIEAERVSAARKLEEEKAIRLAKETDFKKGIETLTALKDGEIQRANADKAAAEHRAKMYALDGELSRELSAYNLMPGAAQHLTKEFRESFEVHPEGTGFAVRTPQFQSVKDFLAAKLVLKEFDYFVRAGNPQGGTLNTTTSAATTIPTPPAHTPAPTPVAEPKTLGEAIILHMKSAAKAEQKDGRLDSSVGFGLRASR